MGFKPGDRVVCINNSGADEHLAVGGEYIIERLNDTDVFLFHQPMSWLKDRFHHADPPKPSRAITIRGAFAIDADGKAVIEATGNGDEKALRFVQDCCERHIHSGFFNLVVEIPEPVELTATVGDVK